MRRVTIFLSLLIFSSLIAAGCGQSGNNANTSGANANGGPLPPEFSTTPLPVPSGSQIPGIPDPNAQKNANNAQATPTPPIPGIPDPKAAQNTRPTGSIPGIPDEVIRPQQNNRRAPTQQTTPPAGIKPPTE